MNKDKIEVEKTWGTNFKEFTWILTNFWQIESILQKASVLKSRASKFQENSKEDENDSSITQREYIADLKSECKGMTVEQIKKVILVEVSDQQINPIQENLLAGKFCTLSINEEVKGKININIILEIIHLLFSDSKI